MATARPRQRHLRNLLRPYLAILLIAVWLLTTATGALLWLVAPEGPRSGREEFFLGLTKSDWSDIHLWVSVAVVAITVTHLAIDWPAFKGAVRHLMHPPTT